MTERYESMIERIRDAWFTTRGWVPFPFQEETWKAHWAGRSGLVHAPTGMGKTYAVWGGPVMRWLGKSSEATRKIASPLQVLWITPLRALAQDTHQTLEESCQKLELPWTVELRTGDSSSSVRQRQKKRLPTALVTTPESLSLLLSYPDSKTRFSDLQTVIVDEWHELLGSRRGVMTELALARLRRWNPKLQTWGLSATLGNLEEAHQVLMASRGENAEIIGGHIPKDIQIETIIPETMERFPWGGHLGTKLLPEVINKVERATSTLLFTNTRSQTELWYQALLKEKPDWSGSLAIHHGSIDRDSRLWVEDQLRAGGLKCVVCTSSLDLGVDFSPVEQVIQIGSPKGVARFLQRAGRSGHNPGRISRVIGVPTHAFELIEFAAARESIQLGEIEPRVPLRKPLDLLSQHLVTMALGGGFDEGAMRKEIMTTFAFSELTDEEWGWALDFVMRGGKSLQAYPQFAKVVQQQGLHVVESNRIARMHRMSIGVIASDSMMTVKYSNGGRIGSVEESFVARLRPGDVFHFAGKALELIQVRDMQAIVKKSGKSTRVVPRWMGGSMPLSSELARGVTRQIEYVVQGKTVNDELRAVEPLLTIQQTASHLPSRDELLIEQTSSRDGYQIFVFPFAGRLVHEGLASLVAYRITRKETRSLSLLCNDYGFELVSPAEMKYTESDWRLFLSPENLLDDIIQCVNQTELAKRQFRAIARVAGLVFSGYPGQNKSAKQLQVSTGLLYEVFEKYDPDNMLLDQARREVLESQLEFSRLQDVLNRLCDMTYVITEPERLTPFSFPLWAERIRTQVVSSETWRERVERMSMKLERAAQKNAPAHVSL